MNDAATKDTEVTKEPEGWTWLGNSRKWHYFVGDRSLCRKWGLFATPKLQQGNDDSPDNCAECRRRLKKRQAKKGTR